MVTGVLTCWIRDFSCLSLYTFIGFVLCVWEPSPRAFKKLVTESWLTHGRTRLHLLTVHFQYFLRLNVSSQDLHFLSCELDHPKAETQTCLEGFRTQKIKDLLYKLFRLLLRVPYLSHNFMPLKWRIQVSRDTDSTDAPASFICGKD